MTSRVDEAMDGTRDGAGPMAALATARVRILVAALAVFVVTLVGASLAPATWVSEARLLVDLGDRRRSASGEAGDLDDRLITAQIRLLGSRDVLRRAVAASGVLAEGAADPGVGWADGLTRALGLDGSGSPTERRDRLVAALESRLVAERIDRSRLVSVRLTAREPDGLARLLASVLDEYLAVVTDARAVALVEAEHRSTEEIETLRERIAEAEARVEGARAAAGILDSGAERREAVLEDLTAAKARRTEIETRLRLVERGGDRRALDAAGVGDAVSPLLARLRDRRVALRARVTELNNVYLAAHPILQEANSQLAEVERQIRAEVPRVVAALEAERDGVVRTIAALERRLAEVSVASPLPAGEEVRGAAHARDLADLRARLADRLARRHVAAEETASAVGPDVRLVSPPSVPVDASRLGPWARAALAALVAALAVAAHAVLRAAAATRARRRLAPPPAPPAAVGVVPVDARIADGEPEPSRLLPRDLADPLEIAARASLERTWAEIGAGRRAGRRILVTSATTASAAHAAALALMRVAARREAAVCLIDMVASTSGLAARLGEEAPLGLSDLLTGRATFSDVIYRDRPTRGHVVVAGSEPLDPLDLDAYDLDGVLDALDQTYAHLILDIGRITAAEGVAGLIASADAVVLAADGNACDPHTLRAHETLLAADKDVWVLAIGAAAISEVDRAA